MQDTAEERKLAKEFQQAVALYEAMFSQHHTSAVAHTKELLNPDSLACDVVEPGQLGLR